MDANLLRAVKAVAEDGSISASPILSATAFRLREEFDAYVAEIRRRRAESPWKGPFDDRAYVMGDYMETWIQDSEGHTMIRSVAEHSNDIAAALNAFYGYDAQGMDVLEGVGV